MARVVKVLHFTTHDEECGIGKYQEQFLHSMGPIKEIENTIFEYSPNRTKVMNKEEFEPVFEQFSKQMEGFDILHVQHEFSFYSDNELDRIVSEAKRQSKKVIITVHTVLDAGFPSTQLRSLHPKKVVNFLKSKKFEKFLTGVHVVPMQKADLVLTHNKVVEKSLIKRGINQSNIKLITMPVPVVSFSLKSTQIAERLKQKAGDIIFCTVGFLSANKGMKEAVQALKLLPENYKLALIGGAHPSGANNAFIEEIEMLIKDLHLENRAYITGYIKADDKLNALVRECDVCVYPYDKVYYAGVTSAALNNALANYKPVIAYPTQSIVELNQVMPVAVLCDDFDYNQLAENIKNIDLKSQSQISKQYALRFSYDKEASNLVGIYHQLVG